MGTQPRDADFGNGLDRRPGRGIGRETARARAVLVFLGSILALAWLLFALPRNRPPEPITIVVLNSSTDPVLVDARWWAGHLGVDGPIVRSLEPDSTAVVHRADARRKDICVRVIDPSSHRVSGQLVTDIVGAGDTIQIVVAGPFHDAPRYPAADSCPRSLQDDRVRVAIGRYFDPTEPDRIRRERLIRRF